MATRIRVKRGTSSQITGYTGPHYVGELAYATDTEAFYVSNGTAFIPVGGSSETPTLQSVTDAGNTTTNDINTSRVTITKANTQQLKIHYGGANPVWAFTGASYFRIEKNGSPLLSINSSNRFGIGTTNPTHKLMVVHDTGTATNPVAKFFGGSSAGDETTILVGNNEGTSELGYNNGLGGPESYGFLSHDGVKALSWDENGNVGIGITSPDTKLTVKTTGSYSNSTISDYHIGLRNDTGYTAGFTLTTDGILRSLSGNRKYIFYTDNNTQIGFMGSSKLTTYNSSLRFGTNFGTEDWMVLDTSGKVGIGTTAPTGKLHVTTDAINNQYGVYINKPVGIAGNLFYAAEAGGSNYQLGGSSNFKLGYGNTFTFQATGSGGAIRDALKINVDSTLSYPHLVMQEAGGNVGIGTNSPNSKLEVNVGADQNVAINSHFNLARISSYDDAFTVSRPLRINGSDLRFDISGSEKMRIGTAGNVGIGTTAPTEKLEVAGNIKTTSGNLFNYNANTIGEIRGNANTYNNFDLVYGASWDGSNWIDTLGAYQSHKLTIGTGGMMFSTGSGQAGGFPVAYTERFRISNTGNVGIGTTAPSEKLQVLNSVMIGEKGFTSFSDGRLRVASTTDYGEIGFSSKYDNFPAGIRSYAVDALYERDLRFYTKDTISAADGELRMIISGGGNVGIGTTAPTEKLEVSGNIKIGGNDQYIYGPSNTENIRFYTPGNQIILSAANGIRFGSDILLNGASKSISTDVGDKYFQFYNQAYDGFDRIIRQYEPIVKETSTEPAIISRADLEFRIDSNNDSTTSAFKITKDAGTELMRVNEAGNVGIGTTSPGNYKLKISHNSTGPNNYLDSGLLLEGNQSNIYIKATTPGSTNGLASLFFGNDDGVNSRINTGSGYTEWLLGSDKYIQLRSNFYYGLRLGTQAPPNGTYKNVSITPTTTNTDRPVLSVHGNALHTADILQVYGDNTLNTLRFVVNAAGNVGIGTTSPAAKLDVVGTIKLDDGGGSVYVGNAAGYNDDKTFNYNVGIGDNALAANTSGNNNIAVGAYALYNPTNVSGNIAIGGGALGDTTTGYRNTAVGHLAHSLNTSGYENVAIGHNALGSATSPYQSVAVGSYALSNANGVASDNTGIGYSAMSLLTTGRYNTSLGTYALSDTVLGSNNTAVGYYAGGGDYQGTNSVYLGMNTAPNSTNETNQVVIGYGATGNGSNSVTIGNTSITKTIMQEGVGVGVTSPTSSVHIDGAAMRQLRINTPGGPTSSADTTGNIGDIAYDDLYFYIKTINGWGRVPLDFGF